MSKVERFYHEAPFAAVQESGIARNVSAGTSRLYLHLNEQRTRTTSRARNFVASPFRLNLMVGDEQRPRAVVEPHAPRARADGVPEAGLAQHALPAQANGILGAVPRARPAVQVHGIPEAQPRVPLAQRRGILGVQPDSPEAPADGTLEADPAARAADTVQPELKAGDRRQPAQMQAVQWPQRRVPAEVEAVEPLTLQTELAASDSVRESAWVGVAAEAVW